MQKLKQIQIKIIQKIGYDNTAYICWVIASLMWNIAFIYPTQHKIGPHATNLSRGLGMMILNGIGLYWRDICNGGTSPFKQMKGKQIFFMVVRHVLLTVYGYGFAESQFYLPLPVIYTIYFSGPFFVITLQYVHYKIALTERKMKGAILTAIGVILASNGQLIWAWITNDNTFETKFEHYKTQSFAQKSLVTIILIILTFGWAYSLIVVRKVQGHSHWTINFNYGIIMTMISALSYSVYSDKVISNNPIMFVYLMLRLGMITAIGQIFFMTALLLTKKAGEVSIIGFVSVIFSYFISVWRYNQTVNYLCLSGSIIALIGISYIVIK